MNIGKFYDRLLKNKRKKVFLMFVGLMFISGFNVLVAYLYMHIIDELGKATLLRIATLLFLYICMNVVSGLLEYVVKVSNQKLTNFLELKVQKEIFEALLKQDGNFYSKNVSGELMVYLISDATSVAGFISNTFFPLLVDLFKGVGILCFLLYLRWKLLLILLVAQPVVWFIQKRMQRLIQNLSEKNRRIFSGFVDITREYCENLLNIIMISAEKFVGYQYEKKLEMQKSSVLKTTQVDYLNRFVLGILYLLPLCGILMAGSYEMRYAELTLGGLLLFIQYAGMVIRPIESIYDMFYEIAELNPSLERICELLSGNGNVNDRVDVGEILSLGVKEASFTYPNGGIVFRNISFCFYKGNSYAITGESGVGKSTLCKVLLGLWKLNEGDIVLNGQSLSPDTCLKEYITYITQNDFILNDTIYNNIVLGNEEVGFQRFQKAIEISELDSLISSLDQKEQTMMGDCGNLFSGGEKQRVGIARAIIRDNPIVVFDEPTAGLDRVTGKKILNKLMAYFSDKLLIFITHDEMVYSKCDYICCLYPDQVSVYRNGDENL